MTWTWNHRVIRSVEPDGTEFFGVHEVHYDDDGKPSLYSADPVAVCGGALDEIRWTLDRMREAVDKPILSKSDFVGASPDSTVVDGVEPE
jgi:hypothetical protein